MTDENAKQLTANAQALIHDKTVADVVLNAKLTAGGTKATATISAAATDAGTVTGDSIMGMITLAGFNVVKTSGADISAAGQQAYVFTLTEASPTDPAAKTEFTVTVTLTLT